MLAMGWALVAKPRLLLIDEPSMGLAPLMVEEIFTLIRRLKAEELVDDSAVRKLEKEGRF